MTPIRNKLRSLLSTTRPRPGKASPNGDALSRSLGALADNLSEIIRDSESDSAVPLNPRNEQRRASLATRQEASLSEVRRLAKEAPSTHQARLVALAHAARHSLLAACRQQVKKLRLYRAAGSDLPGGEG